jgi:hypothetical protein
MTLPMLPASVLTLIERDRPDDVRRYRQAHGLRAPDERRAPEQAHVEQTATAVQERKRTRRRRP